MQSAKKSPQDSFRQETDANLGSAVAEAVELLQNDPRADLSELFARHASVASRLRKLVPTMKLLAGAGDIGESPSGGSSNANGDCEAGTRLGDFVLQRVVGRGGMGIVFEAEQLSLARRIALKVLPTAATLDERQLARFHIEAQAAAQLHHPHIVPVHAVGSERGVHYYAMQFIDGRSLAAVIDALQVRHIPETVRAHASRTAAKTPDFSSPLVEHDEDDVEVVDAKSDVNLDATTSPNTTSDGVGPSGPVELHGCPAFRTSAYFRWVATIGIQAADALEYAHAQEIVHRDIKPANLLLEEGRGGGDSRLWVTDFGLARIGADANLTLSGDLLGTLRYMSPEQARAKRGGIDHRTDIYSLGATLYEIATLRPAIAGEDRQEVLQTLLLVDPPPPRKLVPQLPRDLETVILKAMAKEPTNRYQTAKELADDLRRLLANEPIAAKRPSTLTRIKKWMWRHRGVSLTAAAGILLAIGSAIAAFAVSYDSIRQERDAKGTALNERILALAEKQQALKTAEANHDRAQATLTEAISALTRIHQDLSEMSTWTMDARMLPLLRTTLGFFHRLEEANQADSSVRRSAAHAWWQTGMTYWRMGDRQQAEIALRTSISGYQALLRTPDGTNKDRGSLAKVILSLARFVGDVSMRPNFTKFTGFGYDHPIDMSDNPRREEALHLAEDALMIARDARKEPFELLAECFAQVITYRLSLSPPEQRKQVIDDALVELAATNQGKQAVYRKSQLEVLLRRIAIEHALLAADGSENDHLPSLESLCKRMIEQPPADTEPADVISFIMTQMLFITTRLKREEIVDALYDLQQRRVDKGWTTIDHDNQFMTAKRHRSAGEFALYLAQQHWASHVILRSMKNDNLEKGKRAEYHKQRTSVWTNRGRTHYDLAREATKALLERYPHNVEMKRMLASLSIDLAALLTFKFNRDDDFALAERLSVEATRLDPSRADPHRTLGLARFRLNKWREAEAAFDEMLRYSPSPTSRFNLAMALWQLGQKDSAVVAYRKGVADSRPELLREASRIEAAALLGINDKPLGIFFDNNGVALKMPRPN